MNIQQLGEIAQCPNLEIVMSSDTVGGKLIAWFVSRRGDYNFHIANTEPVFASREDAILKITPFVRWAKLFLKNQASVEQCPLSKNEVELCVD